MAQQVIECDGESLPEARQALQRQVPDGWVVLNEVVLSPGGTHTVEGLGATVEDAQKKAQETVPGHAALGPREVLSAPSREVQEVLAFDEDAARGQIKLSPPHRLESLTLVSPGSRGFFGLGRRPHLYSAVLTQPAKVRLTYRERAKLRAVLGPALNGEQQEQNNVKQWAQTSEPREWVEKHQGRWNHADWEQLLSDLARSRYWPMNPAAIGLVLEGCKETYLSQQKALR